ncbi:MAG: L,D-transpeptidase family protein [Pseudomonadota bacterium]
MMLGKGIWCAMGLGAALALAPSWGAGAFGDWATAAEPDAAARLEPQAAIARGAGAPPQLLAYQGAPAAAVGVTQRSAAFSRSLAAAAGAPGLNAAAPATPGGFARGAAFEPSLLRDAVALEAIAGPPMAGSPRARAIEAALRDRDAPYFAHYHATGFAPIWIDAAGGADKARSLLGAFAVGERHAVPERYGRAALSKALDALESSMAFERDAAQLELALSDAFVLFASDLASGFIDPRSLSRNMDVERPRPNAAALLLAARRAGDMSALAERMAPQTRDYQHLLGLYDALRRMSADQVWGAPVTTSRAVRPFDRGPVIDALKTRLAALGDLPAGAPRATHPETGETLYDQAVERAVRAFQGRHGLAVDGVVGANTRAALNASALDRARQVAVNLERARWRNVAKGARHVQVNIPDYHVDVMERGRSIFRTATVVGKRQHQTPEFSDVMTHLVINPRWHVPYSIATEQLLPQLQEDPGALERRGFKVFSDSGRSVDPWLVDWWGLDRGFFPYRLRQEPGPQNALGEVKFIFPNHHAVYLHDTPSRRLFGEAHRAFSHGCVRVEDPRALAKVLLAPQSADPARVYRRALASPGERHIEIKDELRVHLLYRTAWVDQAGRLQLRPDVYRRDAKIAAEMAAEGLSL